VEENNKRYQENPQLYRTRRNKQLVEFSSGNIGTIKRQWVTITSTTGRERVNGEHSLIMLFFNIERTINILGIPDLV
jgi:hypothetical protein